MSILGYWPSQMQMYLQDRSHLVELRSSIRDQVVMTDFLLAQKFRLFGVKMESGMMRPPRLLLRTDTMSSFNGWGNKEEVDPGNVRPIQEGEINPLLEAEREAEATRQAIKRKIAQAGVSDLQSRSLPAKLLIDPNDPEDVKAAKRKKIHAFKSKVRFEQLEVVQNKRQNAWQQFQTTKGKTKKVGFFSGRKRESIFKSPDDPNGKVGVTNSGKGLTDFQRREKYLQLKGANMDSEDQD